ncbi:MAG: DUF697 domain-containing protein [Leptospiraceae bacterium]|nr:DUF697 domain-containing protein [Leptospiraceae bacterium]MCP5501245.1 DUF697 domain-containing protein [Leptospiraceae bacterium]
MENEETPIEEATEESKTDGQKPVDNIIVRHVLYAMTAGAIPVPFVDIAAVTAIQLDMIKQLSDAYGQEFDKDLGKSFASSLAGATLGRLGASAIKALPGVGTWIGITSQMAMAGASTYALGHIFNSHFANKGTIFNFDADSVKKKYEEYLEKSKGLIENLKNEYKKEDQLATIEKLHKLKESGAISEEEFEQAKKSILDKIKS